MNDTTASLPEIKGSPLSEHDSKNLIADYGIPVTMEKLVHTGSEAISAALEIGFPVAVKACGSNLVHKTESGAVFLNITELNTRQSHFMSRNLS